MTLGAPRVGSRLAAAACAAAVTAVAAPAALGAEVSVAEETRSIATYEEGLPDPNPPFDLFTSTRFNYPYTIREKRSRLLPSIPMRCSVLFAGQPNR